MQKSRDTKH